MIHRITSSLRSFKPLAFKTGLNVLMAKKEAGASEKQTRNRAGKTSLIEIVHLLLGADAPKNSLFRTEALVNATFSMEFDLGGERLLVERAGQPRSRVFVRDTNVAGQRRSLANSEWIELLGERMFGLDDISRDGGRPPTFRSLIAYLVRRQQSSGFTSPEKHAEKQQPGDFQVALLFLLGLDWRTARDWQGVRDREKTLTELRKAARAGTLGSIVGKASELRTQLTVAEARLAPMRAQLAAFQVLPQYAELEAEANQLTLAINDLANANVVDTASIGDLERAMGSETPPSLADLERVYEEAGVVLPGAAFKRYDEVRSFHESVIRNRREYLTGELEAARARVKAREIETRGLDERRSVVMRILKSHGALDQFSLLQGEAGRVGAAVESLRQRFSAAEQLEGTKNELQIERRRLELRLRRDFAEQRALLSEAILAFEETSKRLYESAGSMTVEETLNGPAFQFPVQGARSKGIKNMQIFCFDMMLMRLCAKRGMGPGFLIHDSHLFDGVDGRQLISALKIGAEVARDLGFQYIVTMNEDDAYKEKIAGFDLRDHVLPTVLTDAREDGGLFGFRF